VPEVDRAHAPSRSRRSTGAFPLAGGTAGSLGVSSRLPQSPPAELLAEDAVLLAQELDDLKSWREWIQPAVQRTRNHTASVPIAALW
jgi:hypothetical protein